MKQLTILFLALTSCARPIGVLSATELIAAGRPREAWTTIQRDATEEDAEGENDPKLLALHQAALLHAGGSWAESEEAFTRALAIETGYRPLPAEVAVIARLRAANVLAMTQNATPFLAAFPKLELKLPATGNGEVVVIFERGNAPRTRFVSNAEAKTHSVVVSHDDTTAPSRWQIDDGTSITAKLHDSLIWQWSNEMQGRVRSGQSLGAKLGLDPFAGVRDALARRPEWWTPPSEWMIGQSEVPAGKHVVTFTTAAGRRARVVDVPAGQRVFVVVAQ